MNDETSLSKEGAHEIEEPAGIKPQSEGASDPKVRALLDRIDQLITQLDPVVREELAAKPESLAEWDALMQEYAQNAEEEERPRIVETVSQKEAEEERLSREINERMDLINSDLERFMDRDPLDLEVEPALKRNFAAMHEVDAAMRERCRDLPEQLAEWEAVMEGVEEVETRFAIALEVDNAALEN